MSRKDEWFQSDEADSVPKESEQNRVQNYDPQKW